MPKCKQCGKFGFFLRLDLNSKCEQCAEKAKRELHATGLNAISNAFKPNMPDWVDGARDAAGGLDVAELSRISRERSDALHEQRQSEIRNFDVFAVRPHSDTPVTLTSPEKYFLDHISTQLVEKPYVQGYWYYEYGLEYADCMTKLIENRYLEISSELHDLTFLSVEELKEILKSHNFPVSGDKQALSARLLASLDSDTLKKCTGGASSQFRLTDTGRAAVSGLPKSITKDIDMEDACIESLINNDFDSAYRRMCEFEVRRKAPRGIGIDWSRELANGLSSAKQAEYIGFSNSDLSGKIPHEFLQYSVLIKACVLLTTMLGKNSKDIMVLFLRITNLEIEPKEKKRLTSSMQGLQFEIL